jgi:hypothetical protein
VLSLKILRNVIIQLLFNNKDCKAAKTNSKHRRKTVKMLYMGLRHMYSVVNCVAGVIYMLIEPRASCMLGSTETLSYIPSLDLHFDQAFYTSNILGPAFNYQHHQRKKKKSIVTSFSR